MNPQILLIVAMVLLGGMYVTTERIPPGALEGEGDVEPTGNVTETREPVDGFECKPLPLIGYALCDLEHAFVSEARSHGYNPSHLLFILTIILGVLLILAIISGRMSGGIGNILIYPRMIILILLMLGII